MRILYVCNEYPPVAHGGLGVFVQTLAEALAGRGHTAGVIGRDPRVREPVESGEAGVSVLRLPPFESASARGGLPRLPHWWNEIAARRDLTQKANAYARRLGAGLIESPEWNGPLWHAPARPLIVRLHGAHSVIQQWAGRRPSRFVRYCERRNVRLAAAFVAPSRRAAQAARAVLGIRGPLEIIPHGVDTKRFSPRFASQESLEILYAGRIDHRKGLFTLFAAFEKIVAELPGARLSLAGPDRGLLRGLLERLSPTARRRVRWLGVLPRNEMPRLYSRASVTVFPSSSDAFGLVWAEALCCGAALIAGRQTAIGGFAAGKEAALLIEITKPQELASALGGLLRHPERRRRLARRGRAFAERALSLDAAVERNLAFYRRVIDAHQGRCKTAA